MAWKDVAREYAFDEVGCRMLDTWWRVEEPSDRITQSLRCYDPTELREMATAACLDLMKVLPGGAVDYDQGVYRERVALDEAMQYTVVLRSIEGHSREDQSRSAAVQRR